MKIGTFTPGDPKDHLISALTAIGSLDPVDEGEDLLDEVCEWTIRMSGLRSIRLSLIDEEVHTITAAREFRLIPLRDGHPVARSRIKRSRVDLTRPLPRRPTDPKRCVEDWAYWNPDRRALVVDGKSEDDILDQLDPDSVNWREWERKGAYFHALSVAPVVGRVHHPIALFATAFAIEQKDEVLDWFESTEEFWEVVANRLFDYIRGPLAALRDRTFELTAREEDVLREIGEGWSNAVVAERLGLSVGSVKTYRSRIREKTQIYTEAGLVKLALRLNLTSL